MHAEFADAVLRGGVIYKQHDAVERYHCGVVVKIASCKFEPVAVKRIHPVVCAVLYDEYLERALCNGVELAVAQGIYHIYGYVAVAEVVTRVEPPLSVYACYNHIGNGEVAAALGIFKIHSEAKPDIVRRYARDVGRIEVCLDYRGREEIAALSESEQIAHRIGSDFGERYVEVLRPVVHVGERGSCNNYTYLLRVGGNYIGIHAVFSRNDGAVDRYGVYRYYAAALNGESHSVARAISAVHALYHGSAVVYFGNYYSLFHVGGNDYIYAVCVGGNDVAVNAVFGLNDRAVDGNFADGEGRVGYVDSEGYRIAYRIVAVKPLNLRIGRIDVGFQQNGSVCNAGDKLTFGDVLIVICIYSGAFHTEFARAAARIVVNEQVDSVE